MHPTSLSLENRPVFGHEDMVWTVGDVIGVAFFLGAAQSTWGEARLADETAAQAGEEDAEALQELSEEFRYQRDLITSEETERWLEARDLTLEDFENYLVRLYWRKEAGKQFHPSASILPPATADDRELLRQELFLSGAFEGLAGQLSRRAAALIADSAGAELDAAELSRERERFFARAGLDETALGEWLAGLERDSLWLEKMLRMEAAYQRRCEILLTPAIRFLTLNLIRLPMLRFEVETIDLDSREAAQEAALCLTEDHMSMADLANETRYPYRRYECLLSDLPEGLQQDFLGGAVGSVVGPWDRHGGFQLYRICNKMEPKLEDEAVRERVDREIMDNYFSELDSKMIRWFLKDERPG